MKPRSIMKGLIVLPIGMLLASNALADRVTQPASATFRPQKARTIAAGAKQLGGQMTESERIYDAESGDFIDNPNYYRPVNKGPARMARSGGEPYRIYDAESGNFIDNPNRNWTASRGAVTRTGIAGEPDRIYNPETGNFEDNPNYFGPAMLKQMATSTKAGGGMRRTAVTGNPSLNGNPSYHRPATVRKAPAEVRGTGRKVAAVATDITSAAVRPSEPVRVAER